MTFTSCNCKLESTRVVKTPVNTCCEKIGRNFVFVRFLAVTNMPNSVERSSRSKKNKLDNFIWSDDEVELLLNVVLEYKTARTMENVDWDTRQHTLIIWTYSVHSIHLAKTLRKSVKSSHTKVKK